ncbi:MAG: DUF452 family protein [Muribaculaceae bacterium]|nr:DUF452 family protein [Muribaculaceae bacterium]
MNISFIDKGNESRRLILVFPGWSCGKELYADFSFNGWDVAVVEGYDDLSFDSTALKDYPTIYLFAWSLGVYMASVANIEELITGAFALNGTLIPADDSYGIPVEIYKGTATNLSPRNLLKFRRRMAGDATTYKDLFSRSFSQEETELLKKELLTIAEHQNPTPSFNLPWSKVFLSENDAIFPYENMKRHWEEAAGGVNCEIIPLKEGHYVPLDRIVRFCIPSIEKVSRRFSKAASTYNRRAVAQRELASILCRHMKQAGLKNGGKFLEIGPGTGLFTEEVINTFSPSEIDFVDISDMRPDAHGLPSSFHQTDAEEWIANSEGRYDAILSSSTVQWFVNLPLFIKNASERLKEGGMLGFSTFLPGTMEELSSFRPSPLHYHSPEEIAEWLEPYFKEISIETLTITLSFDSPRELFSHLRETGVGGSAPSGNLPLSAIRKLRTLTFHCGCFSGKLKEINTKE